MNASADRSSTLLRMSMDALDRLRSSNENLANMSGAKKKFYWAFKRHIVREQVFLVVPAPAPTRRGRSGARSVGSSRAVASARPSRRRVRFAVAPSRQFGRRAVASRAAAERRDARRRRSRKRTRSPLPRSVCTRRRRHRSAGGVLSSAARRCARRRRTSSSGHDGVPSSLTSSAHDGVPPPRSRRPLAAVCLSLLSRLACAPAVVPRAGHASAEAARVVADVPRAAQGAGGQAGGG